MLISRFDRFSMSRSSAIGNLVASALTYLLTRSIFGPKRLEAPDEAPVCSAII